MPHCEPHDSRTGCAIALICQRCRLCLIHCTCPPEPLRSAAPDSLAAFLRRDFPTRQTPRRKPYVAVLLAAAAALQAQSQRAAERIQQAQYCAAVEARAQYREVNRVQPQSHLTPAEEAANHKAELDRLVTPEKIGGKR
jgi:hypothetical protein